VFTLTLPVSSGILTSSATKVHVHEFALTVLVQPKNVQM